MLNIKYPTNFANLFSNLSIINVDVSQVRHARRQPNPSFLDSNPIEPQPQPQPQPQPGPETQPDPEPQQLRQPRTSASSTSTSPMSDILNTPTPT